MMRNRYVHFVLVVAMISVASRSSADEVVGAGSKERQTEAKVPGIKIVLAGDSTVTTHAGWGTGFCSMLQPAATCVNLAQGGRSSRSFRSEGWWQKCLDQKPDFLLIQFGHNDQPGKGPRRESAADGAFREHLCEYVDEAAAAGIRTVLITSLARRRWNADGYIDPTLAEYAAATRIVAREKGVPLLDLNRLSIEHCNSIGPEAYRAFEPMSERGVDHTHLNTKGSAVVGRIVAAELIRILPELKTAIRENLLTDRVAPIDAGGAHSLTLSETESTISINDGEQTVLVYNKISPPVPDGLDSIYCRSGFLHPVMSPGGKVLTATFPFDHAHQHGIFSAWVRTSYGDRNVDFWNLAGRTGRVLHQRVLSRFRNSDATGFEAELIHRAVESPVVDILRERWKVSVHPSDGTFFCFDLDSVQEALTDTPLVVEKYHYGGFAVRGRVGWLSAKEKQNGSVNEVREPNGFLNDHESDRVIGNHEHSKWVSLSGRIADDDASITVLCHPSNFRAPQPARLHPSKPYFCFSPCVEDGFVIEKGQPLVSGYRFLVTDSPADPDWINSQWQIYQKTVR